MLCYIITFTNISMPKLSFYSFLINDDLDRHTNRFKFIRTFDYKDGNCNNDLAFLMNLDDKYWNSNESNIGDFNNGIDINEIHVEEDIE